jgi:hypothetical protein
MLSLFKCRVCNGWAAASDPYTLPSHVCTGVAATAAFASCFNSVTGLSLSLSLCRALSLSLTLSARSLSLAVSPPHLPPTHTRTRTRAHTRPRSHGIAQGVMRIPNPNRNPNPNPDPIARHCAGLDEELLKKEKAIDKIEATVRIISLLCASLTLSLSLSLSYPHLHVPPHLLRACLTH